MPEILGVAGGGHGLRSLLSLPFGRLQTGSPLSLSGSGDPDLALLLALPLPGPRPHGRGGSVPSEDWVGTVAADRVTRRGALLPEATPVFLQ